jgi:hypothetical protein
MAAFTTAPSTYPVVRQGSKIIIPVPVRGEAAILPPPCVKCGSPADGKPVKKTFFWHSPMLYLIILLSPLIYVIVALIVRKGMRVRVPFCMQHAQRRSTLVMLAWVLPVIGIADAIILPRFGVDVGIVVLITLALIVAGVVMWAVVSNPIRPSFIDQFRGDFTGFSQAYLQSIPEAFQQPAAFVGQGQLSTPPPPVALN